MKIGLLDQMGGGNLGDAAIQDAVIQQIRRRLPSASLHGISFNPADTERRHGLTSFPIRPEPVPPATAHVPLLRSAAALLGRVPLAGRFSRALGVLSREAAFLARTYRTLRDFDLLVVSGGGQLDDMWGGARGAPWTIFSWTALARLAGARVAFLCVGAGPLRQPGSRALVRLALRLAQFRSFRDEESRALVERLGVGGDNAVVPDAAHALTAPTPDGRRDPAQGLAVGLAPIPWRDPRGWPDPSADAYAAYVDRCANFAAWLIEQGHRVRFLTCNVQMDRRVVDDIRARVAQKPLPMTSVADESIESVEDLLAQIAETDVVLSSRFHGVLLAHLLNRPVIALSYHQKIDSLMADMGQADDVLPIDGFSTAQLIARFQAITADLDAVKARLSEREHSHQLALEAVFDSLFGPAAST